MSCTTDTALPKWTADGLAAWRLSISHLSAATRRGYQDEAARLLGWCRGPGDGTLARTGCGRAPALCRVSAPARPRRPLDPPRPGGGALPPAAPAGARPGGTREPARRPRPQGQQDPAQDPGRGSGGRLRGSGGRRTARPEGPRPVRTDLFLWTASGRGGRHRRHAPGPARCRAHGHRQRQSATAPAGRSRGNAGGGSMDAGPGAAGQAGRAGAVCQQSRTAAAPAQRTASLSLAVAGFRCPRQSAYAASLLRQSPAGIQRRGCAPYRNCSDTSTSGPRRSTRTSTSSTSRACTTARTRAPARSSPLERPPHACNHGAVRPPRRTGGHGQRRAGHGRRDDPEGQRPQGPQAAGWPGHRRLRRRHGRCPESVRTIRGPSCKSMAGNCCAPPWNWPGNGAATGFCAAWKRCCA